MSRWKFPKNFCRIPKRLLDGACTYRDLPQCVQGEATQHSRKVESSNLIFILIGIATNLFCGVAGSPQTPAEVHGKLSPVGPEHRFPER